MDIHLNNNETVSLSMKTHIKEAIEAYGDDVSMKIATPLIETYSLLTMRR